jgi:hypothetical protein
VGVLTGDYANTGGARRPVGLKRRRLGRGASEREANVDFGRRAEIRYTPPTGRNATTRRNVRAIARSAPGIARRDDTNGRGAKASREPGSTVPGSNTLRSAMRKK